jgi:hypothetical protein
MMAKLLAGIAEKTDADEMERHLWSGAKWVRGQVVLGKTKASMEDVIAQLVPAAVATGLVDQAKARRQIERGWTWAPAGQKKTPAAQSLPKLPRVQHSVTTASKPVDVKQAVELLLAVFADARVRSKVSALILDALEVHAVTTRGVKDGAA